MQNVLIGCGQLTWHNMSEDQVMDEIVQAGYAGAPADPQQGRSTQETLALFAKHGLKPAPGYLGADFQDKAQEAQILTRAKEMAAFGKAAGYTELYVAAGGFDKYVTRRGLTRRQISGHVKPEDAMTPAPMNSSSSSVGSGAASAARTWL